MPSIVFKFENSNVQTFKANVTFTIELPFAIYFNFETISGKKTYDLNQDTDFYPVSYTMVIAFHPKLNLDKTFIVRSFEQLSDI